MTLFNTRDLLTVANRKGGFAVGAFNVNNMEYTQGVIQAAELEEAPVILMIGEPMIKFFGLDMMIAICESAAKPRGCRWRLPWTMARIWITSTAAWSWVSRSCSTGRTTR